MAGLALLFLFCLSPKSRAADFVVSNNAVFVLIGDSYDQDQFGSRYGCYLHSYLELNYPQYNIYWRSVSRAGGSLEEALTNRIQSAALAHWGYQFNNHQHVGLVMATDNGGDSSNQVYNVMGQIFQAPAVMSDGGLPLTTQTGWCATNTVQWIGIGEIPQAGSPIGATANRDRNNAATNAGWQLGVRGIDLWNTLAPSWTNNLNYTTNGLVGWFPTGGHPGNAGQLCMALVILRQLTTDTNIADCTVDWNGSLVSTNHCVVNGVTQTGNSLTFQRKDDRLPMAYDVVDGYITNDCRNAFKLMPELGNAFNYSLKVNNLPSGLYSVLIDGTLVGILSDSTLAAGWNMFTNNVGPIWDQRKEVLGRTRDQKYVNRVTMAYSGGAGDHQGLVWYGSDIGQYWTNSTIRGDRLISSMAPEEANIIGWDQRIHDAAQPTTHTFTVTPFAPTAVIKPSALTNALNTPVVLDGSSSIKATNYLWEQISPVFPRLDMLGQDRAKPLLISVTNPGTYTFRLTVNDGQTASSNQVTLTFVQPTGRTIFVDNRLAANCPNNNYSIANRNGAGSDGLAYTNIQSAVNISQPGDLIAIRAGLYTNAPTNPNQILVMVTHAGTATAPIRYQSYNNESVTLAGWGFSDADTNADGKADGPTFPGWRQQLFFVPTNINYIQVKGLQFTNSQQGAMNIEGSFCYVEECVAGDNWGDGFDAQRSQAATNALVGTVFRWCEVYRSRHLYGFELMLENTTTYGFMSDCAIVDCLAHNCGYQPDGQKVLPINGDPAGGGNCDGIHAEKYFADNANFNPQYGVRNWGTNLYFVRDIVWNNCDDGIDLSSGTCLVEDCRALFNGPTGNMGYKLFRYTQDMVYRGNIAYGNVARGFELRIDTNSTLWAYNNSSFENLQQGYWIAGSGAGSVLIATNNVAAFNGGPNWPQPGMSYNWASDGGNVLPAFSGNPTIVNTNLSLTSAFGIGWTVRQKRDYMDNQIKQALSPAVGSPLLNAGAFIPGYHCARADNDPVSPMSLNAPGRHWKIPGPNLGAFDLITTSGPKPAPPTNLRSVTNF